MVRDFDSICCQKIHYGLANIWTDITYISFHLASAVAAVVFSQVTV